ncbi:DUF2124 domain-containing protein [Methanobacterium sp. CWC-01]|jgi:hypothetical protein|uniref:DUF2124 family protein n=1 Tax=Methanobacterium aridiramus TaxID=2584467 RepID=UPI002574A3AA|nr:DUF2124 family protein [Methanobacterium sp. CWC-01]WJI09236.1 DUF2124 domain-containing protein [Methanobacterium sp. CWC-01]
MEPKEEFKGITGNLMAFKKEVAEANKVTFAGLPGVCTPFAELFAYVIRDKESVFITGVDAKTAKKMEMTPQGIQLTDDTDPRADVLAILGGLSMPKANLEVEDIEKLKDEVLKEGGKMIGLCYMSMFQQVGWDEKLDFDCIIDGHLSGEILR